MTSSPSNVRVVCRFRPLNKEEISRNGGKTNLLINDEQTTVKVQNDGNPYTFTFDRIFPSNSFQKDVYEDAAKPVVEDIMKGYNGTIFVYGQTGSGKTFTMQGPSIDDEEMKGIIPRMIRTIFESVQKADENVEFVVKSSYLEIYMEKIRDLLDNSKVNLKVREEKTKGIWVEGATEIYVSSEQEVLEVLRTGSANRAIAETKMNSESSRSHSIFILSVNQRNLNDMSNKTGKLYLVDLAGSEKVEKTGAEGTTLDEAKMINKSLSALGNVINALTDGKSSHIPYRDSKLTRVLQESLGGNSRTTLIINCSPSVWNEAETLSTLRFGNRAKSIQNKAKINAERSVAELKILLAKSEKEIERLNTVVGALNDEILVLKGLPPDARLSLENGSSSAIGNLPNVQRLQEVNQNLESEVQRLEEEKARLQELNDELKEKEIDYELIEQLKEQVANLKISEINSSKENELLIVKLADLTIANEKLQFENSELSVNIERLSAQILTLEDEKSSFQEYIEKLQSKYDKLALEQKSNALQIEISSDSDKEDQKTTISSQQYPIDEESTNSIEENTTEEGEILLNHVLGNGHTEIKDELIKEELGNNSVEELKIIIERQRKEILQLKQERKSNSIQKLPKEQDGKRRETIESQSKGETVVKKSNISSLDSLLLDLENRCKKVAELEHLLDEAQKKYQTLLLAQVKNPNEHNLQRKCIFLQKNLEQLTKMQQELMNENARLKTDNQAYLKKIAFRNERIHGLELLLADAQEKNQRHAMGIQTTESKSPPAAKTQIDVLAPALQTRLAKPLRGGGGKTQVESANVTPEKKNSSFWDFLTKKTPKSAENGVTSQKSPIPSPSFSKSKPTSPSQI